MILAVLEVDDQVTPKLTEVQNSLDDLAGRMAEISQSQTQFAATSQRSADALTQIGSTAETAARNLSQVITSVSGNEQFAWLSTLIGLLEQTATQTGLAGEGLKVYHDQVMIVVGGMKILTETMQGGVAATEGIKQAFEELNTAARNQIGFTEEQAATFKTLYDALQQNGSLTDAEIQQMESLTRAVAAANVELSAQGDALRTLVAANNEHATAVQNSLQALAIMTKELGAGKEVTDLHVAALKQVGEELQTTAGFTDEHKRAVQEYFSTIKAGQVVSEDFALTLREITQEYANAAEEGQGYVSAITALAQEQREAAQETTELAQSLMVVANSLRENAELTTLQKNALEELASKADAAKGISEEQRQSILNTTTAIRENNKATTENIIALSSMSATLAGARTHMDDTRVSADLLRAEMGLNAAMWGALTLGIYNYIQAATIQAARNEVLSTVMGITAKNASLVKENLEAAAVSIQKLGITSDEATNAVLKFVRAQLDVADAAKLARTAQDLAVIANKNSSDAFGTLVYAIERTSPILLRQFGIVTSLSKVYAEYAREVGKTARELTEAERKQAFLNMVLEEGAKVAGAYSAAMGDVGKQQTSLKRYYEELAQTLGKYLLPLYRLWVQFQTELLQMFLELSAPLKAFLAYLLLLAGALSGVAAAMASMKFLGLISAFAQLGAMTRAVIAEFVKLRTVAAASGVANLVPGILGLGTAAAESAKKVGFLSAAYQALMTALGPTKFAILAITAAVAAASVIYAAFAKTIRDALNANAQDIAAKRSQIDENNALLAVVEKARLSQLKTREEQDLYNKSVQKLKELNVPMIYNSAIGRMELVAGAHSKINEELEKEIANLREVARLQSVASQQEKATLEAQIKSLETAKQTSEFRRRAVQAMVIGTGGGGLGALQKLGGAAMTNEQIDEAVRNLRTKLVGVNENLRIANEQMLDESTKNARAYVDNWSKAMTEVFEEGVMVMADRDPGLKSMMDRMNALKAMQEQGKTLTNAQILEYRRLENETQATYTKRLPDLIKQFPENSQRYLAAWKTINNQEVVAANGQVVAATKKQIDAAKAVLVEGLQTYGQYADKEKKTFAERAKNIREGIEGVNKYTVMSFQTVGQVLKDSGGSLEEWARKVGNSSGLLKQFDDASEETKAKVGDLRGYLEAAVDWIQNEKPFYDLAQQLREAGTGTDEWWRAVEQAREVLTRFGQATDDVKDKFPELKEGIEGVKALDMAGEVARWAKEAEQARIAFAGLSEEIATKLNTDLGQAVEDMGRGYEEEHRSTLDKIYQYEADIYDKVVMSKMNEVDRKVYENNRYWENLQVTLTREIEALEKQTEAERTALSRRRTDSQNELDELYQRSQVRLKIVSETEGKITDLIRLHVKARQAFEERRFQEGESLYAEALRKERQYLDELTGVYDRASDTITATYRAWEAEASKVWERREEDIEKYKRVLGTIPAAHAETNREILKQYDTFRNVAVGVAQDIATQFAASLSDMVTGAKSFKDIFIGVWQTIKNAVLGILNNIVEAAIAGFAGIGSRGKAGLAGLVEGIKGLAGSQNLASAIWKGPLNPAISMLGGGGAKALGTVAGMAVLPGTALAMGGFGSSVGISSLSSGMFTMPNVTPGATLGSGSSGMLGAGLGSMAGAAAGGLIGFGVGNMTGSKTWGALSGAGSGALTGLMMGGPIGAAVGGIAGLLGGLFGGASQAKKVRELRESFIEAAGGLEQLKRTAEDAGISLDKFFAAKKTKDLEKAIKDIEASLKRFQTETLKGDLLSGMIDKNLQGFYDIARAAAIAGYEVEKLFTASSPEEFSAELEKFQKALKETEIQLENFQKAAGGISQAITGVTAVFKTEIAKWSEGISGMKDKFGRFVDDYRRAVEKGFKGTLADYILKEGKLSEQQFKDLQKIVERTATSYQNLGIVAATTVAGMIAKGMGAVDAILQVGGALKEVRDGLVALGYEVPDVVQRLLGIYEAVEANQDVYAILQGITLAVKMLGQAGLLTAEDFNRMGAEAAKAYDLLITRGVDAQTALILLQPSIQALWEAQQRFGLKTDEATQKLIDMGVEQGIVGDQFKDISKQMLDMLLLIAEALGAKIPEAYQKQLDAMRGVDSQLDRSKDHWRGWRDTAIEAARDVQDEVNAVTYGRSPGGIKDIIIGLMAASEAMKVFERVSSTKLPQVEGDVKDLSGTVDSLSGVIKDSRVLAWAQNRAQEALKTQTMVTGHTSGVSWSSTGNLMGEATTAMERVSRPPSVVAPEIKPVAPPQQDQLLERPEPVNITIAPSVNVNALDTANFEETFRTRIGPEMINQIKANTDQIATDIEGAISRYRRG